MSTTSTCTSRSKHYDVIVVGAIPTNGGLHCVFVSMAPDEFRRAHGAGWALVGDAGHFKDPGAAHGLSNALRDAELLATAVVDGDMERYERVRDDLSMPLFGHIERLTALDWDAAEAQRILFGCGLATAAEARALAERRSTVHHPVG